MEFETSAGRMASPLATKVGPRLPGFGLFLMRLIIIGITVLNALVIARTLYFN